MTHLVLPSNETRRLSFYLAMEEYATESLPRPLRRRGERQDVSERFSPPLEGQGEALFFLWQVRPTVIFGRHQVIENEVNLDYCREHGIEFYRRKSGGGCVYADQSNVMMSYITRSDQVQSTFREYMQMVCEMLKALGLDATSTENNDVLIGGRKVSGNAYYHKAGWSIVHGTMLFDTDMQHMLSAITPPRQKLTKHGVESVRQRITLLKEHVNLTLDEVKALIRSTLCDGELMLTDEQVREIEAIEQGYLASEFIHLIQ